MSKERPAPDRKRSPAEHFGLTEHERLYYRVRHERLVKILDDEGTVVHRSAATSSSTGEFLFLTLSRPGPGERQYLTFYGLGYHEIRERWLLDEWAWHHAHPLPDVRHRRLSKEAVQALVDRRRQVVAPLAAKNVPARRGRLFAMAADLTDTTAP